MKPVIPMEPWDGYPGGTGKAQGYVVKAAPVKKRHSATEGATK